MIEIIKRPSKYLELKTQEVNEEEIENTEFQNKLKELIEAGNENSAVGVAANQIGWNRRVFIYLDIDKVWKTVINPRILMRTSFVTNEERCLSCEKAYKVRRAKRIKIKALDENGEEILINSKNKQISFRLQHEIDHLNGITIADKGK